LADWSVFFGRLYVSSENALPQNNKLTQ